MIFDDYKEPVAQLLRIGDFIHTHQDVDYRNLGITPEFYPELIRLAGAATFMHEDANEAEAWGTLHAWKAIGELEVVDAVPTLIEQFALTPDTDWIFDSMPRVMVRLGIAAVAPLTDYLQDAQRNDWARIAVIDCLREIALAHPEAEDSATSAFASVLRLFSENDESLNAFLISSLITLKAMPYVPLIQAAYESENVDLTIRGDWEDAQIELGLLSERLTPRPHYFFAKQDRFDSQDSSREKKARTKGQQHKKKRKLQAKARKLQRKRK